MFIPEGNKTSIFALMTQELDKLPAGDDRADEIAVNRVKEVFAHSRVLCMGAHMGVTMVIE